MASVAVGSPSHGFRYERPASPSDPIIRTGNVTMGGASGTLGLADPNSQGTTLLAKINHQLVGIFQAGKEWGSNRGYTVQGKSDSDGNTVHAEEYLIAALDDIWEDLVAEKIVTKGVAAALTIKITKSPCPGCKDQLIDFVGRRGIQLRIKAAQLWARKSGHGGEALLSIQELAIAGITVLPWDVRTKAGKTRKDIYGGGKHELGSIDISNVNADLLNDLKEEYAQLCKAMGLDDEKRFQETRDSYKKRLVRMDEGELKRKAAILHAEAKLNTQGELEKVQAQINELERELTLTPRRSERSTVSASSTATRSERGQDKARFEKVKAQLQEKLKKHDEAVKKYKPDPENS